jgi:basic amino acid/polyamine antiporter, APA family
MKSTTVNQSSPAQENFGLATGLFVVIASMVGTGILTTSGFTVASVGSHNWAWLLWAIGGVLAVCGALSQSELVSRNPHSGGDYVILSDTFGPFWGFLTGWVSLVLGFAGPIAASSKAAAAYFLASLQVTESIGPISQTTATASIATLLVIALAWAHSYSHSRSSLTQIISTTVKLILLLLFLISGLVFGFAKNTLPHDMPNQFDGKLFQQSLTSLIYISYAYTGWNSIGFIAGEIRNPQKNLSRSILIGTTAVTVLYIGINLVYGLAISAGDLQKIADQKGFDALAPIAEISARRLFGDIIGNGLSLIVSIMLISSVSAYLLSGPRIIYAMARTGHFPAWASKLNEQGVPQRATVLQTIIALIFVWSSSLEGIIVVSGLGLAWFSMLTIATIFYYRHNQTSETYQGFRCPLYPLVPAVYLMGTGLLTIITIWNKPFDALTSLALISIGAIAYRVFRVRSKMQMT